VADLLERCPFPQSTHDVTGTPLTPHVRIDDHENDEQQSTQVVDAQADDEHVDESTSMPRGAPAGHVITQPAADKLA